MEHSVIHVEQLLDIMRGIGDSRDIRQITISMMERYTSLFGKFSVFGLLLSYQDATCWRCLPLQNPAGPNSNGVSLEQVPANTDLQQIVDSLGHNVTHLIESRPALRQTITTPVSPFAVEVGQGDEALLNDLNEMLQTELSTIFASCQQRPLSRGPMWVFLGWKEKFNAPEGSLSLFDLTVETVVRMAAYLSLYSLAMRLELINQSVRRNIVHDLKTPVTVIQGCTDVLLSQEEDDPELRHEMLSIINEQTHRLSEELQEILAPPVDQNWMPRYEEFDLRLVVDKAIMAEKQTERARGHRFESHGDKGPLLVTADRRKVRRVVENLLSNAIKYSPGEEKTVHVTVEARDGSAVLGVRDEGIGMTHEQLAHVLAAPGRVVAPDLDIEGSGFGLDSCRQILAAHGGTLQAESEPGEGSTFVITLPIAPPVDLRIR